MTKKDYIRAAQIVREMPERHPSTRVDTSRAFADLFEGDERFDRAFFLAACHGGPVYKVKASPREGLPSPRAADQLVQDATDIEMDDDDLMLGQTDCPEGCVVEPDGMCPHGYQSAALTLGVI